MYHVLPISCPYTKILRKPDGNSTLPCYTGTIQRVFLKKERQGFSMAKTYVIDTNVLIQAPNALLCFEENQLCCPWLSWKNWMA